MVKRKQTKEYISKVQIGEQYIDVQSVCDDEIVVWVDVVNDIFNEVSLEVEPIFRAKKLLIFSKKHLKKYKSISKETGSLLSLFFVILLSVTS